MERCRATLRLRLARSSKKVLCIVCVWFKRALMRHEWLTLGPGERGEGQRATSLDYRQFLRRTVDSYSPHTLQLNHCNPLYYRPLQLDPPSVCLGVSRRDLSLALP